MTTVIVINGADTSVYDDTGGTKEDVIRALRAAWGAGPLLQVLKQSGFVDLEMCAVAKIDRVVPSIVNTDKAWYEASQLEGPYRGHPDFAVDWNLETMGDSDLGEPVCSPFDGLVINAGDYGGVWGRVVRVLSWDGNEPVVWMGAHLSEIEVYTGQLAGTGEIVGAIGKGPDGMYSAHLHEQISVGHVLAVQDFRYSYPFVDPIQWYKDHGVSESLMDRLRLKDEA